MVKRGYVFVDLGFCNDCPRSSNKPELSIYLETLCFKNIENLGENNAIKLQYNLICCNYTS